MVITSANWNKSKPHSAYNSDHTQQYSLHNSWCGSAKLSHTTPLHLSLFLSSPHLHPSPMPQYLISLIFDSSPSGCALLNQTAISERNSTSKPANTLHSRGAHTEGCFIAQRAVTHAWLPISLFIIWCEKLIIFFYQMFNQQREGKGVHMYKLNYSEKHLLLHKHAYTCTYDNYLIQKETCCVWRGQHFWESFCLKTPSSHRMMISPLGTLWQNNIILDSQVKKSEKLMKILLLCWYFGS